MLTSVLMADTNQAFLSYASNDLATVRRRYADLIKCGVAVWFDKVSLGPGKAETDFVAWR